MSHESLNVPGTFACAIEGRDYVLDVARLQYGTMELIRQQADTSETVGEQSLNPNDLWRRSQDDWHLGAGQEWLDRRDSSPLRFWKSSGIDPWERGRLRLLPDVELVASVVDKIHKVVVAPDDPGGGLGLWIQRQARLGVIRANGTTAPTTTIVDTDTHPNARIVDIATDGRRIFATVAGASGDSGLYYWDSDTSSWTKVAPNDNAQRGWVGFVKGRLLVSELQGNGLYNITDLGAGSLPPSLADGVVNPNLRWMVFGEGVAGIYAAASPAPGTITFGQLPLVRLEQSSIYRITIREDGSGLRPPVHAADLPLGEQVFAIQGYLGVVLIGTNLGFRVALEQGGGLVIGPCVEVGSVLGFAPHGRFVYATVKGEGHTGLIRIDLSRFIPGQELVPAWAPDLAIDTSAQPVSVVTYARGSDRRRLWVSVSDDAVYAEDDDLVSEAWIDFGRITHRLADKKIFHVLEWRTEPLPEGASVKAEVFIDGATDPAIEHEQTEGTDAGPAFAPFDKSKGEWANVKLTVTGATDPEDQVEITRWLLRSNPVPRRSDLIPVPINLHATVETLRGQRRRASVEEEFEFLRGLAQDGRPVTLQLLGKTLTVFVDRVVRGDGLALSEDKRAFEGPCTVFMRAFDVQPDVHDLHEH